VGEGLVTRHPSLDVPTGAIRDAVAAEIRLAELRRRRDEVVADFDRMNAEREAELAARAKIPHCATCGKAHPGRYTHDLGTVCFECHRDSRLGRFTRDNEELRDVLAWRAVTGSRDRRVHVIVGLGERLGFTFFCETDDAQASSTRFAFAGVSVLRERLAALDEPPPGMRRTRVTELAEFAAARRRARLADRPPEPLRTEWPDPGSWRRAPGPDGVIPSTMRLGDEPWLRAKVERLARQVRRGR
jgi:hypothetical protein